MPKPASHITNIPCWVSTSLVWKPPPSHSSKHELKCNYNLSLHLPTSKKKENAPAVWLAALQTECTDSHNYGCKKRISGTTVTLVICCNICFEHDIKRSPFLLMAPLRCLLLTASHLLAAIKYIRWTPLEVKMMYPEGKYLSWDFFIYTSRKKNMTSDWVLVGSGK